MQKKIIALAIAAAFSAPAMAEVTIYGVADTAILKSLDTNGGTSVISSGLAGSRLGVTAAEDLDNGMKAVVKVEYALDFAAKDSLTSTRQEMLALAGSFGTIATGYLQTTGFDFGLKFDPTGGSAVSPLQALTAGYLIGSGSAGKRAAHALAYISPNIGGITAAVNHTNDLNDDAADTDATLLSATYSEGPLAAGGVYAAGAGSTEFAAGASYDLGMAKVFGTFQSNTSDAAGSDATTVMSFSAVAPVGPGAVAGSFATATDDSVFTVAYLQGLSKTTTAYAAYKSSSIGATDSSLIAVGLSKKF